MAKKFTSNNNYCTWHESTWPLPLCWPRSLAAVLGATRRIPPWPQALYDDLFLVGAWQMGGRLDPKLSCGPRCYSTNTSLTTSTLWWPLPRRCLADGRTSWSIAIVIWIKIILISTSMMHLGSYFFLLASQDDLSHVGALGILVILNNTISYVQLAVFNKYIKKTTTNTF